MAEEIKESSDCRLLPPHGFVRLVDRMGDDSSICRAARTSYGPGTKSVSDDRALIRYLMRHRHSTPFEFVQFTLHSRLSVFVARQWMRHRTGAFNEQSARYSEMKDEFYLPDHWRQQSTLNKQGSDGPVIDVDQEQLDQAYSHKTAETYALYQEMLSAGVAREQARMVLPVSIYTEFYWTVNLHNLMHFLGLRMHPHAQQEIRDYATAMFELIRPIVPVAAEAFLDYQLNAMQLSASDIAAMTDGALPTNKRELRELFDKACRLRLSDLANRCQAELNKQ